MLFKLEISNELFSFPFTGVWDRMLIMYLTLTVGKLALHVFPECDIARCIILS